MATIRARYEKGVLKPLEPLDLEEGREVDVYVPADDSPPSTAMNDATPQDGVTVEESDGGGAEDATGEKMLLVYKPELWEDLGVGDPPPGMHPTVWWISNLHKKYPGAFDDVPTDLSINYKHYLYGHPKVSEEE